jgi:dihydrodipicolinate reductase
MQGEQATYATEERAALLQRMRQAKDTFYSAAVSIGVHQFVEFAGLIYEYIEICETTHQQGRDFATGTPLAMKEHHAIYLAEKLDCIYGPEFAANPALRTAFVEAFVGSATPQANDQP